jgi:hypothetical protein
MYLISLSGQDHCHVRHRLLLDPKRRFLPTSILLKTTNSSSLLSLRRGGQSLEALVVPHPPETSLFHELLEHHLQKELLILQVCDGDFLLLLLLKELLLFR